MNTYTKRIVSTGLVLLVIAGVEEADASLQYQITRIYAPGDASSYVCAINNQGEVLGEHFKTDSTGTLIGRNSFVYSSGQITDLDIEIGGWYGCVDINDNSDVVVNTTEGSRIVKKNGTRVDLEFLPKGMNNHGEVVGYRSYYTNDQRMDLTVFGVPAKPWAINDNSVIVGLYDSESGPRSFKWENGVAETLFLPDQCGNNTAYDINNVGQIVGDILKSGGVTYPCLWEDDDCRFFATLGGDYNHVNAINDLGVAVGTSQYHNSNYNAVIYFEDKIIDLNDFLPADSEWLYLREALDINNRGEIVGIGHIKFPHYTIPETPSAFGFLAIPIPEPSSVLLLGVGLSILLNRKKQSTYRKGS